MKFFQHSNPQTTARSLKFSGLGCFLISLGLFIVLCDPIQMVVDHMLSLKPGTFLYKTWEKPPLDVYVKVYMFNVTNHERYVQGLDDKIKVEEVGPYVYQEYLTNNDAVFNDNDTVTFKPRRQVEFRREMSVGDPKVDMVIAPNIPYMGVTSAASDISFLAAIAVRTLMRQLDSQVMLKVSVHDYLWGVEDHLVHLASKIIPSVINFEKFGLLDRMFDEGYNVVTMNLPSQKDKTKDEYVNYEEQKEKKNENDDYYFENYEPVVRDYSIDTWNGRKGMTKWGYKEGRVNTECNTLEGTYDGTLFPRNITKGEKFRIYRKAFCRTLPIEYTHPGTVDGVEGYFFKLADNAFDTDINDPQSSCFCKDDVCLKKGLGSITPCYYNIPLAVSFPHFYNSDPTLMHNIEGLNPSEEKHGTEIVIQPQLGVPMKVHTRFQVNLLMGDIKFNNDLRPYRDTTLPVLWLEMSVDSLSPDLLLLLQLLFNICPYLQIVIVLVTICGGLATIAFSILLLIWSKKPIPPIIKDFDPKVELRRYSEIYLFPLLKRDLYRYTEEQERLTQHPENSAESSDS